MSQQTEKAARFDGRPHPLSADNCLRVYLCPLCNKFHFEGSRGFRAHLAHAPRVGDNPALQVLSRSDFFKGVAASN